MKNNIKNNLKIGYDLDGTLFSNQSAVDIFNRETNQSLSLMDLKEYSFAKNYKLNKEKEIEIWSKFSKEMFENGTPIAKTLSHLLQMKARGAEIIIITARGNEHYDTNKKVLDKWGIPFDRMYTGEDLKYEPIKFEKLDRFFDDKGELIDRLMDSDVVDYCELTLMDMPYNQTSNSHSRFFTPGK